jgi:hypothetical protein
LHGLSRRTVRSEIILNARDGLLRDEAHMDARFGSFGDSGNLDVR